jgi:hypothetical protein
MKIETQEVRDGKHNGKLVWVCHYNRPDMDKKPLRNLPPTKVLVRCNEKFKPKKTVYYSMSHFSPVNKDDKPLARLISPVDNTGFRGRTGAELSVFDTEAECIAQWNAELKDHEAVLDHLIANAAKHWQNQKELLINARQ